MRPPLSLSTVGGGTIELQDATAVFTGTNFGGRGLSSISGGGVTVTSCSGLGGSGSLSGLEHQAGSIDIISSSIAGTSFSVTSGGSLRIAAPSGSIYGITVAGSTFAMDAASTMTLGGSLSFGNAGEVALSGKTFVNAQLSVSEGSSLSITAASGSIGGITVTDSAFALDAESTTTLDGSLSFSNACEVTLSDKTSSATSITVMTSGTLTMAAIAFRGLQSLTTSSASDRITIVDSTLAFDGGTGVATHGPGSVVLDTSQLTFAESASIGLTVSSGSTVSASSSVFSTRGRAGLRWFVWMTVDSSQWRVARWLGPAAALTRFRAMGTPAPKSV